MPPKTKSAAASRQDRDFVLSILAAAVIILISCLLAYSVGRASHQEVPTLGSVAKPISQSLFFKLSDGRVIECVGGGGADSLACDFDHPVTLPSRL